MNRFLIKITGALFLFSGCGIFYTPGAVTKDNSKSLTLLVYMAADNDLECYALENIKAMEHADCSNINVLVLVDRAEGYDETEGNWTDTRLYEIRHDNSEGSPIISKRLECPVLGLLEDSATELDMANPLVLKNFVEFACKNYMADRYALIIWGHGTGWRYDSGQTRAIAVDDRTNTYMSVCDMGNALNGLGLSVVGFDTCFGGVFENVYELKRVCEYTVASPGIAPATGWDYKKLLNTLEHTGKDSRSVALFMAQSAVDSAAVFENAQMDKAMEAVEAFAHSLSNGVTDEQSRMQLLNELLSVKSYSYTKYPCDSFIDIQEMALSFIDCETSVISTNAQKLNSVIDTLIINSEQKNTGTGLHLIPKLSAGTTAACHSEDYIKDPARTDQCAFIRESCWWVPTRNAACESLLDKLFYKVY